GSPIDRGPSMWSDMVRVPSVVQARDPVQSADARQEEVLASAQHIERLNATNASPHGLLRDRESGSVRLQSDDRVAFAVGAYEIAVVYPFLLQKFHGGHRLGAHKQKVRATRHIVVGFGDRVRIVGDSVSGTAPDKSMDIDIGQTGQFGVARV